MNYTKRHEQKKYAGDCFSSKDAKKFIRQDKCQGSIINDQCMQGVGGNAKKNLDRISGLTG